MMRNIFLLVTILCIFFSCKKDNHVPDNVVKTYDKQTMLSNIGNNIVSLYQNFSYKSDTLIAACERFTQQPTIENLILAQESWKQTSSAWQRCELFNFGPVVTLQLRGSIDTWPLAPADIESAINTTTPINNNYIQGKSIRVKGLKAIEYLLFSSAQGNNFILDKYISGDLVSQRKAYLLATTQNLHAKALTVLNAWKTSEGNYLKEFIAADGNDVTSSIGQLVNAIVSHTDEIKNLKIGNPLGKASGGAVNAELAESFQSGTSLQNIKDNITTLKKTIGGFGAAGAKDSCLNDYLDYKGAVFGDHALSKEINDRFKKVEDNLNTITDSSGENALTSNGPQADALFNSMKDLLVILNTDFVNNLGVSLTFTDNDGD